MKPPPIETVLYISEPFKKYRWVSYYSLFMALAFSMTTVFLPTPSLIEERQQSLLNKVRRKERKENDREEPTEQIEEFEPNPDYDPATIGERLKRLNYRDLLSFSSIYQNVSERPYTTLALFGACSLVSGAFSFYARRTVYKLALLPNERVRFSFFSPLAFGKPPSLEVPLRHVSCVASRQSPHNYSILKIKGYKFYFLVHKAEGIFLEPKLYDQNLGFARNWD